MSEILGGSGSSVQFETNGVLNAIQTLLNLIAGSNITLTANGSGGVTITASVSSVPVIVQSNENSTGSASSLSKAFTSGNVAGNSILVIAQWSNTAVTMGLPADTNSNTYASLQGPNTNGADGSGGSAQQIWLATNIEAGANTITITPSANTRMMLIIVEVQNLAVLSTFDQSNWNDSVTATGSLSSGSITTTQAVELLIGYGGTQSQATTITDGTGWQNIQNTSDGTNAQTFFAEYQVVTNTNTYTGTATASPSTTYGMGIVSLRSAITSSSPNAAISTFSTGSLASGSIANGTVTMAKTFALLHVQVSAAARVRLYINSAARTADASRSNQVPPTPGTQSGIITDLYLDTSDKWTWQMTPIAIGYNWDVTQSTTIYYAVTNIGSSSENITVTLTYVPMES
jgi:hypothetical protein